MGIVAMGGGRQQQAHFTILHDRTGIEVLQELDRTKGRLLPDQRSDCSLVHHKTFTENSLALSLELTNKGF